MSGGSFDTEVEWRSTLNRTYRKGMVFGTTADILIHDGVIRCHAVNYEGGERSKLFFAGDTAPSPDRVYSIYPIDVQYTVVSPGASVGFFNVEYNKALTISEDIIECVIPTLADRIFFTILRLNRRGFLSSVNQSELARICGCSRVLINQVVNKCDYIKVEGRKMSITDVKGFMEYATKAQRKGETEL